MRAKVRSTFVANVTFWSDNTSQDSDVLRWCWNSTDGRCARKMEMGTTFPVGVGLGGLVARRVVGGIVVQSRCSV